MPDLYLTALMQGHFQKNRSTGAAAQREQQDKFELETEKQIEEYLQTLVYDEGDPFQSRFTTPAMKRAQLREELRAEAKLSELANLIEPAFKILAEEAGKYLDESPLNLLKADLAQMEQAFAAIDFHTDPAENLPTLLHFTFATLASIYRVALQKFEEKAYSSSLSLFILLVTLVPDNANFWYRAGILAHKCENWDLAIRLYTGATALDPALFLAWIFSSECYLRLGQKQAAEQSCTQAVRLSENDRLDEDQKGVLLQLQEVLEHY